jgi:hypothetical protein
LERHPLLGGTATDIAARVRRLAEVGVEMASEGSASPGSAGD